MPSDPDLAANTLYPADSSRLRRSCNAVCSSSMHSTVAVLVPISAARTTIPDCTKTMGEYDERTWLDSYTTAPPFNTANAVDFGERQRSLATGRPGGLADHDFRLDRNFTLPLFLAINPFNQRLDRDRPIRRSGWRTVVRLG